MQVTAGPYTIALKEPRGEAALVLSGRIGEAIDKIDLLGLLTPARLLAQHARNQGAPHDEALAAEADKALAIVCTRISSLPDATGLAALTLAGSTISGGDLAPTVVDRAAIVQAFGSPDLARHLWPAVLAAWFKLGFFGGGATSESAKSSTAPPAPTGLV